MAGLDFPKIKTSGLSHVSQKQIRRLRGELDPIRNQLMQPTLETLHAFYEERFGGPLPTSLLPPDQPLIWREQNLFGSAQTAEGLYLIQSTIDQFLGEAPLGYLTVGFWGHGMNSYGFYYQRREQWCSIFLRLAYGGVYEDNVRAAQEVKATMEWFAEFLKIAKDRVQNLIVVDSMGAANFQITLLSGQTIEGNGPLFKLGRGPAPQLTPLLLLP